MSGVPPDLRSSSSPPVRTTDTRSRTFRSGEPCVSPERKVPENRRSGRPQQYLPFPSSRRRSLRAAGRHGGREWWPDTDRLIERLASGKSQRRTDRKLERLKIAPLCGNSGPTNDESRSMRKQISTAPIFTLLVQFEARKISRPRSAAAARPRLGRSTHKQCHDRAFLSAREAPGSDGDPCPRT